MPILKWLLATLFLNLLEGLGEFFEVMTDAAILEFLFNTAGYTLT